MKVKCRDTGEVVGNYGEYLVTQHWRDLRVEAYRKADGKCMCCGRMLTNNFICHHVSTGAYRRLGRERMNKRFFKDDVIAVCRWCHDGESKNHKKLHEYIIIPRFVRSPQIKPQTNKIQFPVISWLWAE